MKHDPYRPDKQLYSREFVDQNIETLTGLKPMHFLTLVNGYHNANNQMYCSGRQLGISWALAYVGSDEIALSDIMRLHEMDVSALDDDRLSELDKMFLIALGKAK